MQRNPSSRYPGTPDEREPDGEDRLDRARLVRDDEDRDGDIEIGVAHRPNPLPLREEEEEELSEADILDESDLEDADDDLAKRERPST
ncbi:MAG: hypothetical protein H7138_14735 [Myxococcales bacterium]|nr:hypothetical protein [Myxococcales bacterium]